MCTGSRGKAELSAQSVEFAFCKRKGKILQVSYWQRNEAVR